MIRVGFVLAHSASWTGGLNYLRNLIASVHAVPDRSIEPVLIVAPDTPADDWAEFGDVPVLRTPLVGATTPAKLLRRGSQELFGRDIAFERFLRRHDIAVLSHSGFLGKSSTIPAISWLPDFQHIRMPRFFTAEEIAARDRGYARIARNAQTILLSSEDAKSDLAKFAPDMMHKARVLRFTAGMVTADDPRDASYLAETYGIDRPFFYVPNQFWRHKNHRLILDALALLKKHGQPPLVVSTGKTEDRRYPEHFNELSRHIDERGLTDDFRILGLIPYADLSVLFRHSVALINPSFFEGWSSTVEESKSLGKAIILSDIPVHREQAPARGVFVPVDDAKIMAQAMTDIMRNWSAATDHAAMAQAAERLPERRIAFGRAYQAIVAETLAR